MDRDRIFARLWGALSRREGKKMRRFRARALAPATGKVLEIGAGAGTNLAVLPAVESYVGIEPNRYLLSQAQDAARAVPGAIVQDGDVQALAFPEASFDTVISTLTFCSVASPAKGLDEVRRVLKPGGQFLFAEHVVSTNPLGRMLQKAIKPATHAFGGGCEWDRDTLQAIRRAGFEVDSLHRDSMSGLPVIWGTARKPAAPGAREGER